MDNAASVLIAAVDIGSPATGKLGWAVGPEIKTGSNVDELVGIIARALSTGSVTLGFEAPQWVPLRPDTKTIMKARIGEGRRAWSASAGSTVLATSLVVVPHILSAIRRAAPFAIATLDYRSPLDRIGTLLLWEAFVSESDKRDTHELDAQVAVEAFQAARVNLPAFQKLTPEPCFNLLGAALLRTGWTTDLAVLEAETFVLRMDSLQTVEDSAGQHPRTTR